MQMRISYSEKLTSQKVLNEINIISNTISSPLRIYKMDNAKNQASHLRIPKLACPFKKRKKIFL